jgi:hypothetical protein
VDHEGEEVVVVVVAVAALADDAAAERLLHRVHNHEYLEEVDEARECCCYPKVDV